MGRAAHVMPPLPSRKLGQLTLVVVCVVTDPERVIAHMERHFGNAKVLISCLQILKDLMHKSSGAGHARSGRCGCVCRDGRLVVVRFSGCVPLTRSPYMQSPDPGVVRAVGVCMCVVYVCVCVWVCERGCVLRRVASLYRRPAGRGVFPVVTPLPWATACVPRRQA